MIKRKKPEADRFFETFAGLNVKVMLKTVVNETVSTAESMAQVSVPLSVMGYLLDADDNYYYIGETPDEASAVVRISEVILVEEVRVKEPRDAYDDLLDTVDKKNMC